MLRGLLRDLRLPAPWPEVGAALWLLEPLGTEAALWPSALHLHLGLGLALGALRLYRRGRLGWAALVTMAACLCAEQVIFAFPLAVGLVTPRGQRRSAVTARSPSWWRCSPSMRPGRAPTSAPPSPSPGGWGRSWSIPSGTSSSRGRARAPTRG